MVKLVLFDIDGTLVHTGGAGRNAFARTLAAAFNSHAGVHMVSFAGRTDVSLVRELFGVHGIPATPENFRKFFDHYAFCLDHVMQQGGGDACDGARDFIRDLLALPDAPMLGLLTGNIRLGAEIKLRSHGLWEIFATGGFADDHEERDQIAAAARARGSRLLGGQLRGDEIVVVGDTPFDIRCGKFIGAKVLAVATGGATLAELKRHQPDWAVENLREINAREILR
jgi:phosphoglycolate phosphatase-like HAD superfamily hydrolase